MSIVYNNEIVAIPRREAATSTTVPTDPYKTFGTEYGMFIPITLSGYQFIRWVRKGMTDVLPKKSIAGYFIHISNDGEVMVVVAETEENVISMVPHHLSQFALLHMYRETTEAYNVMLENCKTISEAVRIIDEGTPDGFYDPLIFFVNDWVKYAKEKGYTKTFYHTLFY